MVGGRFFGLFVGLDVYKHGGFPQLNYAANDAIVLRALFADNFSDDSNLLLDQEATKEGILKEIGRVAAACTPQDVVVMSFSGHGSLSGELVPYDANRDNLHETGIPLSIFVEKVERINARLVIVVLDCCFVGGHLVRGVRGTPDGRFGSRGGASVERMLDRISGKGRFVIAASGEAQRAYEGRGTSHGLLTHYLIKGLLGTGAVLEDGQISLLRLAGYVMREVAAHERRPSGVEQNPTLDARINDVRIPVLERGPKYEEAVANRRLWPATSSLVSLNKHGFPQKVLDGWESRLGRAELNQLQLHAINRESLLDGRNLLVSAPTSAGKTLIGEIAAMRAIVQRGKAVFLLSNRALVHELYERLAPDYRSENLVVVRATGELRDQDYEIRSGEFHIAFCTYEKFISLLRTRPGLLTSDDALIVDEIQMLADPGRGPRLEMLLTWLRRRRVEKKAPQIVGLSAGLGRCEELAEWLGAGLLWSSERPVPLVEGVVGPDGTYRYLDEELGEQTAVLPSLREVDDPDRITSALVGHLVEAGEQVVVFRSTRPAARSLAEDLARTLGLPSAEGVFDGLRSGDEGFADEHLRRCLRGGVAFYSRELDETHHRVLERGFRECSPNLGSPAGEATGRIRVLVTTSALAEGVNLPADSVVIRELKRAPDGSRYPVGEYKNMAGRAGRVGLCDRGRSFIIAASRLDAEQKWEDYVLAGAPPFRSALLGGTRDLRDTVFSIFAGPGEGTGDARDIDVSGFLGWTLASYQGMGLDAAPAFPPEQVTSALEWLCKVELLSRKDRGYTLTELGDIAARHGLHVNSVVTLAEVLKQLPADGMNRATLIGAALLTRETDDERFGGGPGDRIELRRRLRGADIAMAKPVVAGLWTGSDANGNLFVPRARKAIACLLWSTGRASVSDIERRLTQVGFRGRVGLGRVNRAASSVAGVMNAVIEIGLCVNPDADFKDLPDLLPSQLEFGVAAGLVPIARCAEIGLGRAVYLNLHREGYRTVDGVLDADEGRLLAALRGDTTVMQAVLDGALIARERADQRLDLGDLLDPEEN